MGLRPLAFAEHAADNAVGLKKQVAEVVCFEGLGHFPTSVFEIGKPIFIACPEFVADLARKM